ncbi:30S ribosome-binding factor RbfA [uncultured Ruminococcus sp.]|uniref:30S ribosome-binding factor RbfA n=1 Tax=uncultured Ruminococcus sp. TaxID=165186 RepID=UPI0025E4CE6A|nr:30S ribosome-binding factor RbfA [uncultured Ruminococcus sp.]
MGYRAGRMSEDIRRIISGKMRDLKDPRIHGGEMLTVVRCDVANDGSYCKVYISSFEGYEKAKEAVKGFESATGYLKREISNVLKLKKCPELKFVADNSIEHSAEITRKLREIIKDEPSDEDAEDGSEDIEDKEDMQ